jgi:hypothetical protein
MVGIMNTLKYKVISCIMVEIKSTFLETCYAFEMLYFSSAMMQLIAQELYSTFIHHESFKS